MILLGILQFLFALFDVIWNFLFPFDLVTQFTSFMSLVTTVYVPQLVVYLGYICYFIPLSYLLPPLLLALAFIVARIVLALFRVITDLL